MKHNFCPIGKYVFWDEQRGCASDGQSIGICFTVSYLYMTEIGLVLSPRQRCWDVWLFFFFGISFTKIMIESYIMSKLYKTSNNLLGGQYVQRLCKCIYIASNEPYLLTPFSGPLKLIITIIDTIMNTRRFHNMRHRLHMQMKILFCCITCCDPEGYGIFYIKMALSL